MSQKVWIEEFFTEKLYCGDIPFITFIPSIHNMEISKPKYNVIQEG